MANHSFNHEDLTVMTESEIAQTVESTRAAMMKAVGSDDLKRIEFSSRVIRPPYGNIDMNVDKALKAHGFISVRWNADRYDWNMPGNDPKTTQEILKRVTDQLDFIASNVADGKEFNRSILDLNHDWQMATVDAVDGMIALAKARGYEFVTMDVCLGL